MEPKFSGFDMDDLILEVISNIDFPEGISIRPVIWGADLATCSAFPLDRDRIQPHFGMRPVEDEGLTLIALSNSHTVGQMSFDILPTSKGIVDCEVWVEGVFVHPDFRKKGISRLLGLTAIRVSEAWRIKLSEERDVSPIGSITIAADTESGSFSERLIDRMSDYAEEIENVIRDEFHGLEEMSP